MKLQGVSKDQQEATCFCKEACFILEIAHALELTS